MSADQSTPSMSWFFPSTRSFIRQFGWRSWRREILWDIEIVYRFKNWRCWFGHRLGPPQESWEDYYLVESWRYCERPSCEWCERT